MKVVVVGAGKTGKAIARYYRNKGAEVIINDIKTLSELDEKEREEIMKIGEFVGGGHPKELFEKADKVVVSPGVPRRILPPLDNIVGDVEDAYREIDGKVVGITGTNGKTTTTLLVSRIIESKNKRVFVGGNIGVPYIEGAYGEYDYIVLELSSFQLEWIEKFRPFVGVLLNVGEDHMDRYSSYEEYFNAKLRMFINQEAEDYAIVNNDITGVEKVFSISNGTVYSYSVSHPVDKGAYMLSTDVAVVNVSGMKKIKVGKEIIQRTLSYENFLASLIVGEIFGVEPEGVMELIQTFSPPPHRLHFVGEKNGMRFYNDSKATNPSAVLNALTVLPGPILLLMGGRNKSLNFEELFSASVFKEKVKKVIGFGEAGEHLLSGIKGVTTVYARNLNDALKKVKEIGEAGDTVLLSPGCASYDEFKNYEERGKRFMELINEVFAND